MNKRTYYKAYDAWYADTIGRDLEISFGIEGGELDGEMTMKWVDLNGPTPCLECFSDAFHTLASMKDVLQALVELEGSRFTKDEFVSILEKCGFADATPYVRPFGLGAVTSEIARLESKLAELRALLEEDE